MNGMSGGWKMTQKPIFNPRRLGHVNIWSKDLSLSEAFYHDICGLAVEFTEPGLVASFLGTGHTPHDLGIVELTHGKPRYGRNGILQIPPGVGLSSGLNHLAWEMENEADLIAAICRGREYDLNTDILLDHQISHSIYLFDPDNNMIEFYCDTVKDWRSVLHGEMDLITSEWNPDASAASADCYYDENPVIRKVATALIHPRRLTHAVLASPDIKRAVDYYTQVGGLTLRSDSTPDVALLAASDAKYPFCLAIYHNNKAAYAYAAFELMDIDQLEAAEKNLVRADIQVVRSVDLPWKRSFFIRDPDGMLVECYVPRDGERDYAVIKELPLSFAI